MAPNAAVSADSVEVYGADFDDQIHAFLDEHRGMLLASLDGLTEEEARTSVVASKTTLLGLVKHAVFVERVWFNQAQSGRSRSELNIADSPDGSFELRESDTIESVSEAFRNASADSRRAVSACTGDTIWTGNPKRGSLTVRWIELHVLRELAQHCGHADIIREQILAARQARV